MFMKEAFLSIKCIHLFCKRYSSQVRSLKQLLKMTSYYNYLQWPRDSFSLVLSLFWFLFFLNIKPLLATPNPVMTFSNEGTYSLFPNEDLRTGKRNFRFEDEILAANRGGQVSRERQLQSLIFAGDRTNRARGLATFINNNPNSLSNYVIRPLDQSRGVVSFDDDRVRRPVNYITAYRDRNLPFDKPNPLYLPPRNPPFPSSLLRPVIPAFPESKLPPRKAMTNYPSTPTFHIYDPASKTFIPKDSQNGPDNKLPPGIPDPRIKLKPGRLLLPGLHNALNSEEVAGPELFLNHDEYLDFHTKVALDNLEELDRKMHKFKQTSNKEPVNPSNPKDAKVILFDPVDNTDGTSTSTEQPNDYEDGSTETETEDVSLEVRGSTNEGRRPEVQGVKSKVVTYPIVTSSSTFGQKDQTSNKEVKASKGGLTTVLPDLDKSPILTLPPHLKGIASPSQQSRSKTTTTSEPASSLPEGIKEGEPKVKAVKSELGTEITKTIKNDNKGDRDDDDMPSGTLKPPATTTRSPVQQQNINSFTSSPFSHTHNGIPVEIIPSIVTQSSDGGLIDGHFDYVPGITYGPTSFSSSISDDGNDDGFDVARFRTETQTPFLYQESKQTKSSSKPSAKLQPAQRKFLEQHHNINLNKKMILVKRIKNVDNVTNSFTSVSRLFNSSRSDSKKDYEAKMTVHKIQGSSEEKLNTNGGLFSAERAKDFNLQSQSTSSTGVVSKIHAHVSSCPKLDGPSEVICDVHIRRRHGNLNPHLTVGWKRKFYNITQPDIVIAVNKTLAYEEDFHDKFNVTLAPGINPMLRSVLRIRKVQPADTGTYQCEVSDGENFLKSETLLFLCH